MTNTEWLASLKAGDEVAIREGYTYCSYHFAVVDRTTKAQIVIGNHKFWRASGCTVGYEFGAPKRLVERTGEVIDSILRVKAIDRVRARNLESLTTDQLTRIVAILDEGKGQE